MSFSEFTFIQIGSNNRSADTIRAEWWRTVNAVGRCLLVLRNTDQKYNGVFDVQDTITITITDPDGNNRTVFRGRVDGPAVTLIGQDLESPWEEYIVVRGVDRAQDLMFHNDFEKFYPDTNNQIKDILGDLFDVIKAIDTNIFYNTPIGVTPTVGSTEFRRGSSFLSAYQEVLRRAEWVSYVDDAATLRAGAPGFSATGEILTNIGAGRNIIETSELLERDGGKLYNYIELSGKNPMFDAYTEQNALSWSSAHHPGNIEDSTATTMVGTYSQRVYNTNPLTPNTQLAHRLDTPVFNYTTWDFSKGEIGFWGRYDNQAEGGGGEPAAGSAGSPLSVECRLVDNMGIQAIYYSTTNTRLYRGDWGFCTFPLGETYRTNIVGINNEWTTIGLNPFDWSNVITMFLSIPRAGLVANPASNFHIDGLTLPLPAIAIAEDAASQAAYRRRPLPLGMPHLRAQNALDSRATQLLAHHKDSGISHLKLPLKGNLNLHYAGQSVTVNIPKFTLNGAIFYMTEIHHVVEPGSDVTNGYGFDYITEVDLAPIGGIAYDMSRFSDGQVYSPTQLSMWSGTGLQVK